MTYFERFCGHLKTISKHKLEVMKLCFRCGLYKQGLLHDLSKFSYQEFWSSVKYYQGYRSPIDAEKEDLGISLCWLHHKGRNMHHWEYWTEKDRVNHCFKVEEMPLNYLLEAACDKIAASKIYKKENYNDACAYDFLMRGRDKFLMGDKNLERHALLLGYLKDNGEKKTLAYYKSLYKKWKNDKKFNI